MRREVKLVVSERASIELGLAVGNIYLSMYYYLLMYGCTY